MYDSLRAAAMTSYFLERAGGRMNDILLAKMQYLAERTAIVERGAPITADVCKKLRWGPILSQTLNHFNGSVFDAFWREHIRFHPYVKNVPSSENTVELIEPVKWHECLSDADVEILERAYSVLHGLSKFKAHDWCEDNCPEVKQAALNETISMEDMFCAEGDDVETAISKANEIRYQMRFNADFGYQFSL